MSFERFALELQGFLVSVDAHQGCQERTGAAIYEGYRQFMSIDKATGLPTSIGIRALDDEDDAAVTRIFVRSSGLPGETAGRRWIRECGFTVISEKRGL
jgi:hypothetical protein